MVDHICAAIGVSLGRLSSAARIAGARDKGLISWFGRCPPLEFPKTPRIRHGLVDQVGFLPTCSSISAKFDFRDFAITYPRRALNPHFRIGEDEFIFRGPRDLRFDLHLG